MVQLWVDKYRPSNFNQLNFHTELNQKIVKLSKSKDLPHLIFFGPSGSGKTTRVNTILKSMYGDAIDKVKIESRAFTTPSNRKLEIDVISSQYHLEMNPSDLGIHDKFVIQSLIKEIAQSQSVDVNAPTKFKVIVISQADNLSKEAQQALRRTMEKYMSNLRLILIGESVNNLIGPIKSRCFMIRVPRPQPEEITAVLQDVAKAEELELPGELTEKIVNQSQRDLRKALLVLQALSSQNTNLLPSTNVPVPDWERMIFHICSEITKEQTPKKLLEIRTQLYELISKCIPPKTIIKMITLNLINMVEDDIKFDILKHAAEYEYRLTIGSKAIFHLEAYIAKLMSIYKRYLHKIQDEFDY